MCRGTYTQVEYVPRVEDGKRTVTTSGTRIEGSECAIPADLFEFEDPPVDRLDPVLQLRRNDVIDYAH